MGIFNPIAEYRLKTELNKKGLILGPCCGSGSFSAGAFKVYSAEDGIVYGVCKISEYEKEKGILGGFGLAKDTGHCLHKEADYYKQLLAAPHVITMKDDIREFTVSGYRYGYIITEQLIPLNKASALELIRLWINKYGAPLVCAYIAFGILSALKEARDMLGAVFCHRDVRPPNLFLSVSNNLCLSRNVLKVGDFGLANSNSDDMTFTETVRENNGYRAPEKIQTVKSDIYSIALIIAEILNLNLGRVQGKIPVDRFDSLGRFLERMASEDPALRPGLDESVSYFDTYIRKFEKVIDDDRRHIDEALNKLSSSTCISPSEMKRFSNDRTRVSHFEGFNSYLKGDISAAKAHWMHAGDSYSRYYIVTILMLERRRAEAMEILEELKSIEPTHLLFDYVAALFHLNGKSDAFGYDIKAAANAALKRGNDMII